MNSQLPELSPEARRLISEARGADDPTADDRARVKTRWLAGVAAVAGVSSLSEAARAAGGIGWGLKAVGAALAVAAGAIGLYVALPATGGAKATRDDSARDDARPGWPASTPERHQKTSARRSEAREPGRAAETRDATDRARGEPSVEALAVAPGRAERGGAPGEPVALQLPNGPLAGETARADGQQPPPPVQAESARAEVASARNAQAPRAVGERPPARVRGERVPPRAVVKAIPAVAQAAGTAGGEPAAAEPSAPAPNAKAPPAGGQLGEELALLSQVRGSMQEGDPAGALDLLSGYEARFGHPILEMEADALRVDALCRAGRRDAARTAAAAFRNEWPGSPLERRVATACD